MADGNVHLYYNYNSFKQHFYLSINKFIGEVNLLAS